jgi:hypothetical protein
MAFEMTRRAFEHARTLQGEEATRFMIDALIHLLAETEESIEALKLEVAALKRQHQDPNEVNRG